MEKGSAELFIVDTFGMFITRIYTRRAFFMSPTSPPGSIWVSIDKARMQIHSKMPCWEDTRFSLSLLEGLSSSNRLSCCCWVMFFIDEMDYLYRHKGMKALPTVMKECNVDASYQRVNM